jgi:hypothetical protein
MLPAADIVALDQRLENFLAVHGENLLRLSGELDAANISHYSSACNNKHITFDIFPASAHVRQLLAMLSTRRTHRAFDSQELQDASLGGKRNPGQDFLRYLQRWSTYGEQVMRLEGDSPRGVAAARARLIMQHLNAQMGANAEGGKVSPFFLLMRDIGLALEARGKESHSSAKARMEQITEHNYYKALSAAEGDGALNLPPPRRSGETPPPASGEPPVGKPSYFKLGPATRKALDALPLSGKPQPV